MYGDEVAGNVSDYYPCAQRTGSARSPAHEATDKLAQLGAQRLLEDGEVRQSHSQKYDMEDGILSACATRLPTPLVRRAKATADATQLQPFAAWGSTGPHQDDFDFVPLTTELTKTVVSLTVNGQPQDTACASRPYTESARPRRNAPPRERSLREVVSPRRPAGRRCSTLPRSLPQWGPCFLASRA